MRSASECERLVIVSCSLRLLRLGPAVCISIVWGEERGGDSKQLLSHRQQKSSSNVTHCTDIWCPIIIMPDDGVNQRMLQQLEQKPCKRDQSL